MENKTVEVVLVKDIRPGIGDSGILYGSNYLNLRDFREFNGKLYFTADNGENGRELWVSDSTTDGTQLFADINPLATEGSNPSDFIEFNDKLYFAADDGETGRELWISDGTTDGTQLLLDIIPGIISVNPFFSIGSSFPSDFIEFNDKLYFAADDGENGRELWVSDGITDGTQLLLDINPDIFTVNRFRTVGSSSPSDFIEFNDKLYFSADDSENGREL